MFRGCPERRQCVVAVTLCGRLPARGSHTKGAEQQSSVAWLHGGLSKGRNQPCGMASEQPPQDVPSALRSAHG